MPKPVKTDPTCRAETGARHPRMARVWDPLVRIFHWSLVGSFAIAWFSPVWRNGTLHHWVGYLAAILVVIRMIWGFVGPRHARFADFVKHPAHVLGYLVAMARGREPRHMGHNPAGGAMVLALMAGMVGSAVTGWMMTTDRYFGVAWVETAHWLAVHAMLALILLHLAGVALASLRHRENLVIAMITGRKRVEDGGQEPSGMVREITQ